MFKKTDNLVRGGVSYTQCKFLSSILSIIGILYSKSCFKTFFSWVHWRRRQWGSFRQRSAVKLGGSEQNTDSKALGVLLSSLHFLPSSSFSFYSLPSLLCMHRCLIHFVRVVGRPPAQGQFWPGGSTLSNWFGKPTTAVCFIILPGSFWPQGTLPTHFKCLPHTCTPLHWPPNLLLEPHWSNGQLSNRAGHLLARGHYSTQCG